MKASELKAGDKFRVLDDYSNTGDGTYTVTCVNNFGKNDPFVDVVDSKRNHRLVANRHSVELVKPLTLGDLKVGDKFKFTEDSGVSPQYINKLHTYTHDHGSFRYIDNFNGGFYHHRKVERVEENSTQDSTIVTNAAGGKQSRVDERPDLVPSEAFLEVTKILGVGAKKYGEWNWRKIEKNDHIQHAIVHLYKYLSGDRSEDHIGNSVCRTLFAKDCELREKK